MNSLAQYFREIRDINPLSLDEEMILIKAGQKGDRRALNKLVRANLKFVVIVAMKYRGRGLPLEELIAEGNVGLIKAAENYDTVNNRYKFISYSVWWIRQYISKALVGNGYVTKLKPHVYQKAGELKMKAAKFYQANGRHPNALELSKLSKTPISENRVINTLNAVASSVSLDAPLQNNGDENISIFLEESTFGSPEDNTEKKLVSDSLFSILDTLSEIERRVIALRFGLDNNIPLTLGEVGEKANLTGERARQVQETALKRLRHPTRARRLKSL